MLPTENGLWVAEELSKRFALKYWQFTLTATDANRFALRLARQITGRPYILVFNWCYHGTVDESLITLVDGKRQARRGNCGPQVDPSKTTCHHWWWQVTSTPCYEWCDQNSAIERRQMHVAIELEITGSSSFSATSQAKSND